MPLRGEQEVSEVAKGFCKDIALGGQRRVVSKALYPAYSRLKAAERPSPIPTCETLTKLDARPLGSTRKAPQSIRIARSGLVGDSPPEG